MEASGVAFLSGRAHGH